MEILFNVRRVEYLHNSDIFKLSTEELKDILYNSNVSLFNNSGLFLYFTCKAFICP